MVFSILVLIWLTVLYTVPGLLWGAISLRRERKERESLIKHGPMTIWHNNK